MLGIKHQHDSSPLDGTSYHSFLPGSLKTSQVRTTRQDQEEKSLPVMLYYFWYTKAGGGGGHVKGSPFSSVLLVKAKSKRYVWGRRELVERGQLDYVLSPLQTHRRTIWYLCVCELAKCLVWGKKEAYVLQGSWEDHCLAKHAKTPSLHTVADPSMFRYWPYPTTLLTTVNLHSYSIQWRPHSLHSELRFLAKLKWWHVGNWLSYITIYISSCVIGTKSLKLI